MNIIFYFILTFLIFALAKFRFFVIFLKISLLSLLLNLASCQYQRPSKESLPSPFDCQPSSCDEIKVLTGGYPISFVYDNPGFSIRNSISIEDDWIFKNFSYNFLIYQILLAFFWIFLKLILTNLKNK